VDSLVVGAIEKAYHGAGIVVRQLAGGSPWIPLDPSWTEPEVHLNSKRRMTLRRARRLAEQMGPVTVEIAIPDSERLPALLDEVFRVEAAGWKGAKGSALAMDAARGAFFRRYAQDACSRGILRICFLTIGGQTAAAQIAVDTGSQFSLLRTGYDERFSRCSPGMLLTHEGIRYAARRGLCSYEFNGTVEPWTEMWTHHERPSCSIRAYPFTWRGLSAFAADGLRSVPKKFRRITKVSM
jgi:CelD/BcsL family acetyltransferase involved in cellulose biosynthesis